MLGVPDRGPTGSLTESEWLRSALSAAHIVAWEWDRNARVVRLDGDAESMLGAPAGALDPVVLTDRIHPADLQRMREQWRDFHESGGDYRIEFRIQVNGTERWIFGHGAPAGDKLRGILQDITARKRSDLESIQAERRYRRIVETAAEIICILDAEARVQFANPAVSKMTGYELGDIVGRSVFEVVFGEDRGAAKSKFERRRAGVQERYEMRVRRKDGVPMWLDISSTPMLDDEGGFAGSLLLGTVINERKEAEAKLARLREALERSNADLQQFAYVTSHDLQEPLRAINTYTQLLAGRYKNIFDEEGVQFLTYIAGSASRMDRMIRDLLSYSRVVNQDPPPFQQVPLGPVVQWAMMNLQQAMTEADALIEFDNLPVVCGDRTELIQLFQNVLSNAIKYRGGDQPVIRICGEERPDGMVQIGVTDNGIGIAPEYHERVFGLFKRLHGHEYPGTGLGLAICKRIVEKHGGTIWVESSAGQGAKFIFTLPA